MASWQPGAVSAIDAKPVLSAVRLACIGNITVDESVHPDGVRREALGGDAIFAILAARHAGGPASWLAPVGNDLPTTLLAQLREAGLDPGDLPRRDQPTVRNIITYDRDGGRSWELVHGEEHFDDMSVYPADVPKTFLAYDGLLVLAMSVPSQLELTPWLRAHSDAAIYLDLQEDGVAGNEAALLAVVASCDVFLPSQIEAQLLSGTDDLEAAAHRFAELGPSCVVIKRAELGCLVLDRGTLTDVPTEAVAPVDPTGAGDAFCGAFAAVHLETGDAVAAARRAGEVARLAISGYGVEALLADALGRSRPIKARS